MEIQDFKPKQPVDNSTAEGVSAVKEDTPDFFLEDEAVPTVEDDEGKLASPTELVESLVELKNRATAAGKRPLQNMVTGYISQGIAMIDGLLEAFEGTKKKSK
jgi:hypothetical protein